MRIEEEAFIYYEGYLLELRETKWKDKIPRLSSQRGFYEQIYDDDVTLHKVMFKSPNSISGA